MRSEKIILAELDIDIKGLLDSQKTLETQLNSLHAARNKLVAADKINSAEVRTLTDNINKLDAIYTQQAHTLEVRLQIDKDRIATQQHLEEVVATANQTERQYIANNEELINLKKDLNVTDDNYLLNIERINGKLSDNNGWLKENGSEHAKLITTMDDYKQQVSESFDSINVFNGGLSGFVSRAQEAGGTGPLLKNAFNGITGGIKGMGAAVMANPVGAVIAAIVIVAEMLYGVFKNFKPVMNVLEQGMAAVSAVIDSVKNSIVALFTSGGDIISFFSNVGASASKAADEAIKLKEAQQKLADQMELQDVRNERAKVLMEEQIELSKNQTLSEEDRIKAFKRSAQVESENYAQRKKIADDNYNNAMQQIAVGKNLSDEEMANLKKGGFAYAQKLMMVKSISAEEIKALKEAQIERGEVLAEEGGIIKKHNEGLGNMYKQFDDQRAAKDQKAKDDALKRQQEHEQKKQKLIADALEKQNLELNLFVANQGIKAKSMKEELDFAQSIADKKMAIADAEFAASDKLGNARLKKDLAYAEIRNGLAEEQANAAVANANRELQEYLRVNSVKIKDGTFMSAQLYAQEQARLAGVFKAETDYQAVRLAQGVINQQEYDDAVKAVKDTNTAAQDALTAQRDEAAKGKAVADLENKRAADTANMDYDLTFQLGKLDAQEAQEIEAAEKTGADTTLIHAKYSKMRNDTEKAVMDNKLQLANSTFSNIAAIMGKESAAGKAMAVAQATIDTYKSAVSAYSALSGITIVGPVLGAIAAAAAVAAGIANVKKIVSTKAPKAEKGALFNIGGNRHSAGGTMFTGADGTHFEAEQGELIGVMNRNAASHFMAFNNAFPAGGSSAPNYFAGGGIVSREIATAGLNTDELAAKIAQANRSIPPPVVAVQDIITQGNSYVQVRDGANF